jgi:glycosyltransferase involved in cell wall biosynthesis
LRRVLCGWDAYRAVLREDPAAVHVHDPELLLLGIALKVRGYQTVYDVHEDLPKQILTKPWIPAPLRRSVAILAGIAEHLALTGFDAVVAATPMLAQRFRRERAITVRNFPLLREFKALDHVPYDRRPPFAVYTGGLDRIRGLYDMVDAIGLIPERLGARLRIAGDLAPRDVAEVTLRPGWSRVDCLGWLSRDTLVTELSQARIGLVVLHPQSSYLESLPIKLFEYMAAGMPVVASNFPLWKEIIDEAQCGLTVDPQDPTAIARAMEWLLDHPREALKMGESGRQAVFRKFNWEVECDGLLQLYRQRLVPMPS